MSAPSSTTLDSPAEPADKAVERFRAWGLRGLEDAIQVAAYSYGLAVDLAEETDETAKNLTTLFRALARALEMEGIGQDMQPPLFSDALLNKLHGWLIVETDDGEFAVYVDNYLRAARVLRALRGNDG